MKSVFSVNNMMDSFGFSWGLKVLWTSVPVQDRSANPTRKPNNFLFWGFEKIQENVIPTLSRFWFVFRKTWFLFMRRRKAEFTLFSIDQKITTFGEEVILFFRVSIAHHRHPNRMTTSASCDEQAWKNHHHQNHLLHHQCLKKSSLKPNQLIVNQPRTLRFLKICVFAPGESFRVRTPKHPGMTRLGIDDRTEGTTVDLVGPNRLELPVFKTGVGIEIKHQTG